MQPAPDRLPAGGVGAVTQKCGQNGHPVRVLRYQAGVSHPFPEPIADFGDFQVSDRLQLRDLLRGKGLFSACDRIKYLEKAMVMARNRKISSNGQGSGCFWKKDSPVFLSIISISPVACAASEWFSIQFVSF